MRLFGLIGYPLSHSFSAGYFADKFLREKIEGAVYKNFPLESIEQFTGLLHNSPELIGLNVTIPYKEKIIPFLQELDDTASSVGAVNTIKFMRNNRGGLILKGFNTDVHGFEASLSPHLLEYHRKALILGTGGASKAIQYVLNKLGIRFVSATTREITGDNMRYEDIDEKVMADRLLIINATPLGTHPNIGTCPSIPYEFLTSRHILFDLVYNPSETLFMKKGKQQGAKTINGLKMLHVQAEKAWEIWNS